MVKLIKKLFPWKRVIIHYHGSAIRGMWAQRKKDWESADVVLVSTQELLKGAPEKAIYLPNPVDTDLFYPRDISNKNTAFHISYNADELAIEYAKDNKLSLTILDRLKNPIKYIKFGETLSRHEYN
jgi:hypothetical protein